MTTIPTPQDIRRLQESIPEVLPHPAYLADFTEAAERAATRPGPIEIRVWDRRSGILGVITAEEGQQIDRARALVSQHWRLLDEQAGSGRRDGKMYDVYDVWVDPEQ